MTKQTVTCVGTCSQRFQAFSNPPLLPILRMADPGVDNKLNWTQSLGSREMDAGWETSSVAVKRKSWADRGRRNRDISTTRRLHRGFPGFSMLSFILIWVKEAENPFPTSQMRKLRLKVSNLIEVHGLRVTEPDLKLAFWYQLQYLPTSAEFPEPQSLVHLLRTLCLAAYHTTITSSMLFI